MSERTAVTVQWQQIVSNHDRKDESSNLVYSPVQDKRKYHYDVMLHHMMSLSVMLCYNTSYYYLHQLLVWQLAY